MKTQSLSSVVLLEEKPCEMIEPVTKQVNRSRMKSAAMFSGQKTLGGVLVVDDDPEIRKTIRLLLENVGYAVIEAEDGQDAINVLSSGENPWWLIDSLPTSTCPR